MATATERLALLITANGSQAIRELDKVGTTAKKSVGEAETSVGRLSSSLTSVGAGAVAAGATVASGLAVAVKSASDLGESSNKAAVIFGKSFGQIEEFASGAATNLGQSKRAALDAVSTFGQFGKAAGLTSGNLTSFATTLTKAASGIASFNNVSTDEAVLALGAALRGENEPIRKFGVLLDDATLRAEAFKQGLTKDLKASLTPQQKALAAYGQILTQAADQIDDFNRTSDSLPNRQKTIGAQFEDLKAKIGESAIPAFEKLADVTQSVIQQFDALPDSVKGSVGGIAAIGSGAAIALGSLSLLAGQLLKLKELASAGGFAGGAASVAGPLIASAAAGAALQATIDNQLATSAENAAGKMEDFKRSLPTNDLRDLATVAGDAATRISEGPDVSNWERLQRALAGAVGFRLSGSSGASLVTNALGLSDDTKFKIQAINADIDNFKQSIAGLDRATASARINVFMESLQGLGIDTAGLIRIQADLLSTIGEIPGTVDPASDAFGALGDAAAEAGEKTQTASEKFRTAETALSGVSSATDRLRKANETLAKLGQRDTKTIESAYDRVIRAKQRLDDILRGDGTGLEQESPAAQEARARAKLAEANARLAVNPKDSSAQTLKDEAIQQIEQAQRRGQDLARSAQDTARQVRDANQELSDAQKDYAEALKPPDQSEIAAAWKERADAELAAGAAVKEFQDGLADGTISVEAFVKYLDDLVATGLISPETAEYFKNQVTSMADAAGVAASKLNGIPNRNPDQRSDQRTQPGAAPIFNSRNFAGKVIGSIPGVLAKLGQQDYNISTDELIRRGASVPNKIKDGMRLRDRFGQVWDYDGRGRWTSRFHTGGMVPGYGEIDAKLLGGEGVINRRGMAMLDKINSGRPPAVMMAAPVSKGAERTDPATDTGRNMVVLERQPGADASATDGVAIRRSMAVLDQVTKGRQQPGAGTTWNVTNHIVGVREPEQAAVQTVRKMRAKTFLKVGG